jgi:hypothetical protein
MKLIKFFFLFFVISLGMFIGFAVLKPLTELPPPVQENAIASMLVPRAFLLAQNGNFSSLSQQVINSYLLIKGGPIVEFQMPNIHPLQWRSSSVVLTEGQISCHLELALFNHLIYCSELFRLSGTRTHWTLEPISGSIGRVPFSGEFLMLLTPLFEFYATPVKSELAQIANNGTVIIHPGILEFGLQ